MNGQGIEIYILMAVIFILLIISFLFRKRLKLIMIGVIIFLILIYGMSMIIRPGIEETNIKAYAEKIDSHLTKSYPSETWKMYLGNDKGASQSQSIYKIEVIFDNEQDVVYTYEVINGKVAQIHFATDENSETVLHDELNN